MKSGKFRRKNSIKNHIANATATAGESSGGATRQDEAEQNLRAEKFFKE